MMKGEYAMCKYTVIRYWRVFLVLALPLIMVSTASYAAEFWLRAGETTLTMPDNRQVSMWGYALTDSGFTTGTVTSPGPMLVVPPGDPTLIIHLKNDLLEEPTSIVIPGQITAMTPVFEVGRVKSFTKETAPGSTGTYTWENVKPGTYLYQSGSHPAVQVQMGLYGGMKKDYTSWQDAYPGVKYGREGILIFSEIDPDIHDAVASGNFGPGKTVTSTINYDPEYFLMNGQAEIIATGIVPTVIVGEKLLVRLLNAGLKTRSIVLQGAPTVRIAENGNPLPYQIEKRYALALCAGQTQDILSTIEHASTLELYDRRGFVSTGAEAGTGIPTQQNVSGLPIPPSTSTTISTQPSEGGGGGGGGGGCFITAALF